MPKTKQTAGTKKKRTLHPKVKARGEAVKKVAAMYREQKKKFSFKIAKADIDAMADKILAEMEKK